MSEQVEEDIRKIETGIPGFDHVSMGGVPVNRLTLISGTAGSAKTVFACQYLAAGIEQFDESGVFVTFEETPDDIRKNMASFGWDIRRWEADGKWLFVDASPDPLHETNVLRHFDFGALIARIEHALGRISATRLAIDSIGAVLNRFADSAAVRHELFRIGRALRELGVTPILTAERGGDHGPISRFGIEEFVADNVVIFRNVLEEEARRRTVEILKYRGTNHRKGEFPFTISCDEGVVIIPLSAIELRQRSSSTRMESGNDGLDQMCGGGFFRDSVVLVSGATGTGKTLMVTEFLGGGAQRGEKCLLFALEESRQQLFRNAKGWGADFAEMERSGLLKVICEYPESASLEDHLLHIKRLISEYRPDRIAVDSLSALARISTLKGFREFVIALTSFVKHEEVAALLTSTTPSLMGGSSVTEAHISSITDSIVLLRYVEMQGEMHRGIAVLKMRGSNHDKQIREFAIDSGGMQIGAPFRSVTGILSGQPVHIEPSTNQRLDEMFEPVPTD